MEIAVIGNSEFILGFRLAGIRKTYAAENEAKLTEYINGVLGDNDVGILVLNNSDMNRIPVPAQNTTRKFGKTDGNRNRRGRRRVVHERENQEISGC